MPLITKKVVFNRKHRAVSGVYSKKSDVNCVLAKLPAVKLDWNPKSIEGECSQKRVEKYKKNANKFDFEYVQMSKNASILRKSNQATYKICLFGDFYLWISDFLTQSNAHKPTKNSQRNQHWPSLHATEFNGKGLETSFWIFNQIIRLKNLKTKMKR